MKNFINPSSPHVVQVKRVKTVVLSGKRTCIVWPGTLQFLIWTIGFVILLACTIKDIRPLVIDYKYNNAAPEMSLATKPLIPDITICLPFYDGRLFAVIGVLKEVGDEYWNGSKSTKDLANCPYCYELESAGWAFWRHVNSTEVRTTPALALKYIITRFLDEDLDNVTITEDNYSVIQVPIEAVWHYLSIIYQYDTYVLNSPEFSGVKQFGWAPPEALNWFPTPVVDKLYEYLSTVLIPQNIFGTCSDRREGGTTTVSSSDEEMPPLRLNDTSLITVIGTQFCFRASALFHESNHQGDYTCSFDRAYNRSKAYNQNKNTRIVWPWVRLDDYFYSIYPSPAVLYSSIDEQQALYSTSYKVIMNSNESEYFYLGYTISLNVNPFLEDDAECSDEQDVTVCITRALMMGPLVTECGCVPFTFRSFRTVDSGHLPYCNFTNYVSCVDKIKNHSAAIREKCNNKCQYTSYNWIKNPFVAYNYANQSMPRFLLSVEGAKIPYIQFTAVEKTSTEQFISQLGGVMNFYLGISGLTIVAVFILCLDQGRRWHRYNREQQNEQCHQSQAKGRTLLDAWEYLRIIGIFRSLGRKEGEEDVEENGENENTKAHTADFDERLKESEQRMHEMEKTMEKLLDEMGLLRAAKNVNVETTKL